MIERNNKKEKEQDDDGKKKSENFFTFENFLFQISKQECDNGKRRGKKIYMTTTVNKEW